MAIGYKFNGANQDALNDRLLEAVEGKNADAAQNYIDRGANINVRFANEDTALLRATRDGDNAMALMLIGKKASLDAQDANGATALMLAIQAKNLALASALIDANADIALEDRNGVKAFKHAMNTADPAFVQLFEKPMRQILNRIPCSDLAQVLRSSQRDLDGIEPISGDTMLTFAAANPNQQSVAEAFLEAGADPTKPNRAGKTPMEIAEATGNSAMMKLLEQAQTTKPPVAVEKRGPLKAPPFPTTT